MPLEQPHRLNLTGMGGGGGSFTISSESTKTVLDPLINLNLHVHKSFAFRSPECYSVLNITDKFHDRSWKSQYNNKWNYRKKLEDEYENQYEIWWSILLPRAHAELFTPSETDCCFYKGITDQSLRRVAEISTNFH